MVTEIKKGVYWVGVVDWGLRRFHGHELSTHRGTTYNSYLIVDEKVALVDTVWGPFKDELITNISKIVDPARIDYIVTNHSETDHAGSLPAVLQRARDAQVVVSTRGAESVPGHFHEKWNFKTVKTGDRIALGETSLAFIEAPMLHWPDSMFTYVAGRNVLLPNDAFGQHYATSGRFNDEVDEHELYEEALKYYANILTPFSPLVKKKIDELKGLSLPVDVIGPSHGVIWRKDPTQIVTRYAEWAAQKPGKCAVVLYDTMWEATRRMAEAVGDGLAAAGVPFKLFHMGVADRNDVIVEVFKAGAILLGSSTVNNGILPTFMPILEEIRGLKFKNKIGAAFGSYGWSGEAVGQLEEHLKSSKIELVAEGVKAKWQPTPDDLAGCAALGRAVGVRLNAA
ncbi:MAG: flavodoxin domain-containing protein [Deltaproteobacteria bacterium]|nr:flavodoxin domain-containing protein [Deltaproteobacteria bacterium]